MVRAHASSDLGLRLLRGGLSLSLLSILSNPDKLRPVRLGAIDVMASLLLDQVGWYVSGSGSWM